jgi:lipooligosaccharide transport system permease protein
MSVALDSARRVFEHRALEYRRNFRGTVVTSFLNPVLFLASMGLGLGGYVDSAGGIGDGSVRYIEFLGPGLLAATAMQVGVFDSTFPIMGGFVWNRIFHAMHATPISPRGIALGSLAWTTARIALVTAVFTLVLALFGAARSPLLVLALPVAILTGMAFAGFVTAYAATLSRMEPFNYIFRFGVQPLFLFSGTFFALDQLPWFLQAVAWLTPVAHGVALARGLALGSAAAEPLVALGHLAVIGAFVVVGAWLTVRAVERRMVV